MNMHDQTMIKVNVPVDDGIAPLVLALNRFPRVLTLDSCQCSQDGQAQVAFTLFNAEAGDEEAFLADLSARIGARNGDLAVALALEWFAGGATAMAWLRVPSGQTKALAAVLESVADSWTE